jgi:hypothetical protein
LALNKAGRRTPGRQSGYLLLSVILAIAVLVRFPGLDRTSLWYDEAVSWAQSSGSFADLVSMVAQDNYPPLHNIILWLTIPVLGDGETALRLPSAFLGLLAVALMVPIGTMLLDRWAGLLAAALLAVSPYHIWYSTEARMYALLAAAGLAFLLAVLKTLRSPDRAWLAALALSGALFLYSHIYALLGFASVGLVCAGYALRDLVRGKPFWTSPAVKACGAMSMSTLLFLPWLMILANRARSVAEEGFWIAYPDLTFLKGVAFSLAGSLAAFWILAALATVAFWPGASGSRDKLPTRSDNGLLVCAAYTLGPAALAYLYSVLVQPILFDRYLIAAWPGISGSTGAAPSPTSWRARAPDGRGEDGHHGRHQRAAGAQGRPHAAADHQGFRRRAADRLSGAPAAFRQGDHAAGAALRAGRGSPSASAPTARWSRRWTKRSEARELQAAFDDGIRSVAIAFMHAYLTPAHEPRRRDRAGDRLHPGLPSHEVSPLIKLVGRGDTTVVDAYLSPILRRYVGRSRRAISGGRLRRLYVHAVERRADRCGGCSRARTRSSPARRAASSAWSHREDGGLRQG